MAIRAKKSEPLLTAAQCRAADQTAIEKLGIPSLILMENAGRGAADLIESWVRRRRQARPSPVIGVICGKGNNGGDGFVIARHLTLRGFRVQIDLLGNPESLSPDATVNCQIAMGMGLMVRSMQGAKDISAAARRWRKCDVIVDALLGTGFSGVVREPLAHVIERINGLSGPLIVAIDVPSGLNADLGEPGGVAVRAHRTITFLAGKIGFAPPTARHYVGRYSVVDIGAPLKLLARSGD